MKLLILPFMETFNEYQDTMLANYVVDAIVHGSKKLFGANTVDAFRLWYLYKDTAEQNKHLLNRLWGKGFSYTATLDNDNTDRTDIENKIKAHYFDKIICPIHHSKINHYQQMHQWVDFFRQYYRPNDIALVDSWDLPQFDKTLSSKCVYFKRELLEQDSNSAHPLGGGWIPQEKYRQKINKIYDFAPLVPSSNMTNHNDIEHKKTYIYEDEESYYKQYQESFFAYTCKKGGWDCMRHYEIFASYTIPYFTDIETCPKTCLVDYPKDLLIKAREITGVYPGRDHIVSWQGIGTCSNILPGDKRGFIDKPNFNENQYNETLEELREFSYNRLNTQCMVESILRNMDNNYGNFE